MLLSICIPTLNRADSLQKTLQSIVESRQFSEKCEVVICDNNSTDNTREVVASFTARFANVRYFKNDVTIPADANFVNLLKLGSGKYLKLHSDKTLFIEGKLDDLLTGLSDLDAPVVFLLNKGDVRQENQVIHCSDLNEFVAAVSFMSTWMSGAIYRRVEFQRVTGTEAQVGLCLIQTFMLFQLVSQYSRAIVMTGHFMYEAEVAKGGYNLFKVFINNYLTLCQDFVADRTLSEQSYHKEKKRLLVDFVFPWYTLTVVKKDRKYAFDMSGAHATIFKYYRGEPRLYLFPVYFLKSEAIRALLRLRNSFRVTS
jgi:abequosyltransferase